jgi:hypothetical protein
MGKVQACPDLLGEWNLDTITTCDVEVALRRENEGTLSPEYRGGTIVAYREASVVVVIDAQP